MGIEEQFRRHERRQVWDEVEVEVGGSSPVRSSSGGCSCWPALLYCCGLWSDGRKVTATGAASEHDQRSATIFSTYWFLLLAEDDQAVETDHLFCEKTFAATTPESIQMADGSPKLISGQAESSLTRRSHRAYPLRPQSQFTGWPRAPRWCAYPPRHPHLQGRRQPITCRGAARLNLEEWKGDVG